MALEKWSFCRERGNEIPKRWNHFCKITLWVQDWRPGARTSLSRSPWTVTFVMETPLASYFHQALSGFPTSHELHFHLLQTESDRSPQIFFSVIPSPLGIIYITLQLIMLKMERCSLKSKVKSACHIWNSVEESWSHALPDKAVLSTGEAFPAESPGLDSRVFPVQVPIVHAQGRLTGHAMKTLLWFPMLVAKAGHSVT